MTSRFERFATALSEITRYWHKIAAAEMKRYGLKGHHALYLITMNRYPDGITAVRLGELCCRDKADVSRSIAELEDKNLIEKDDSGVSRYRILLRLTDEGKQAAEYLKERADLAVKLGGEGIPEESKESFYCMLELVASNLKHFGESGLPR